MPQTKKQKQQKVLVKLSFELQDIRETRKNKNDLALSTGRMRNFNFPSYRESMIEMQVNNLLRKLKET